MGLPLTAPMNTDFSVESALTERDAKNSGVTGSEDRDGIHNHTIIHVSLICDTHSKLTMNML